MKTLLLMVALTGSMAAGIGIGWTAAQEYAPHAAPTAAEMKAQQQGNRALALARNDLARRVIEAVETRNED